MGTRLILVVIFFVLPYKEVREDFDNLKSQHIDMYKKPHKKIKAYRAFVIVRRMKFATSLHPAKPTILASKEV